MLFAFSAVLMTGSTIGLKWLYGKVNGIEHFQKNPIGGITGTQKKTKDT